MTTEDILRMAREANRYASNQTGDSFEWQEIRDERFATLVAAAEREACAKYVEQCFLPDSYSEACLPDIANELRARGNK